jgi:hypothetical protein
MPYLSVTMVAIQGRNEERALNELAAGTGKIYLKLSIFLTPGVIRFARNSVKPFVTVL